MTVLRIILFILGSYFGIANSSIVAGKTTVTVNSAEKRITVKLENLVSMIESQNDEERVKREIIKILKDPIGWSGEFKNYQSKSVKFKSDAVKLIVYFDFKYTDNKDLEIFEIKFNNQNQAILKNEEQLGMLSDDGEIIDGNLVFDLSKPFSYTIEPLGTVPESQKANLKNITHLWNSVEDELKKKQNHTAK